MKKVLVCLLLVFVLFGCSSNNAKLSDGSEVIWKSKKKSYTANDLFNDMRTSDYTANLTMSIISKIGEKEGIDTTTFKEEAEKELQDMKDQGYEMYISYYYGSEDNYINNSVISKLYNELLKKDATENFEEYKDTYVPYKAQMAYFDDQITAQKFIDSFNEGEKDFQELASENGYTGTADIQIYSDESDVPTEVKETVLSMNSGISSIITSSTYQTSADGESTVTPRYYVVNLISKDANEFKDEFINKLVETILDTTLVTNKYIEKYGVEMHDQGAYDLLKPTYEAIK